MIAIAIIGAGPAGLACAQTLAASLGMDKHPQDLQLTVFDTAQSDLQQAELWCVPGVPAGTAGGLWLQQASEQLRAFSGVVFRNEKVVAVAGSAPALQVRTESGETTFSYVVYAPGRAGDVDLGDVEYYPHPHTVKPWRALRVDANSRVRPGLFVAGIAAGHYSMLGSALGSGVDVACHILSEIEGHPAVVHDVKGGRK